MKVLVRELTETAYKETEMNLEETKRQEYKIKFKDILKEKGYNFNSFSVKHKIPLTTLHSINKRGIENSSIKIVYEIAHFLDTTSDDLYERLRNT